ncbi:Ribonuclease G [Caloramator mitchellensis]|uniref:Ribonuclease G n=1 Tax=Caloramator mitchellensis TaxID=908809 RepID=A0A0R3JXA6_CALMK|nr:ribonuclease E/G [Caloramator mitchellensis]KRQ88152.1 Ribonuclease G [Caloramator mitchellensis]
MKQIYIDFGITQNRFLEIIDGKINNLYVDNLDDGNYSGNIYKARVDYVDEKLKSAFIDIGINRNAIMQLGNLKIRKGDEFLVQVKSDSEGEKGPKVTSELTFPGKNLILLPGEKIVKISKKIENREEIDKLCELGSMLVKRGYGIIFRNTAASKEKDCLIEEFEELIIKWEKIKKQAEYAKAPSLLFNQRDFLNYIFTELIYEYDSVYIKDFIYIEGLKEYIDLNRLQINTLEYVERSIYDILMKNHTLDGVKITIDEVEAFTIFDVNSGDNKNTSHSFFEINNKAAAKIFELIKLRNIGGIIFIDFIDMHYDDKKKLLQLFQEEFKNDTVPNKVYGWTKLGVLEAMRAKKGKKLKDLIYSNYYKEIYNPNYALKLIEDYIFENAKKFNKNSFEVVSSAEIANLSDKIEFEKKIKNKYKVDLKLKTHNDIQNFKFI